MSALSTVTEKSNRCFDKAQHERKNINGIKPCTARPEQVEGRTSPDVGVVDCVALPSYTGNSLCREASRIVRIGHRQHGGRYVRRAARRTVRKICIWGRAYSHHR